jgi:hypothetical protein
MKSNMNTTVNETVNPSENSTEFEVVYVPLQASENRLHIAQSISRARGAMVSSSTVRNAVAPVFFSRTTSGDGFAVRSACRKTLESLPLSYGSPMGHFGIYQRGEVSAR